MPPMGGMPTAAPGGAAGADPFMSAMQEEKKMQYAQMQKAQAAKFAQQTAAQTNGANTGVTPNMFFNQMLQMMGNQGGQNQNQQQNTMMLAAMQNMMQQMSMNKQEEKPQEAPQPEAATPPPDTSNGAFKSLFNNAATSATTGMRHSDITGSTQSNSFSAFGGAPSSGPESARGSEPPNPFSNFGSAPAPPAAAPQPAADANNGFSGGFSNSGWSSTPNTQAQQPPSDNPFDMFK